MFTRVDHFSFTVADLDRSSDWYTWLLGREPSIRTYVEAPYIGEVTGYPDCRMEWALWELPSKMTLELIRYYLPDPTRVSMETHNVGNAHLCLVTDDIDRDYERLSGHANFRSPTPVTVTRGPYIGARVCYLRDPDGITVELVAFSREGMESTQ